MSSPIASGVAALIKTLHPDWNWKQIYHQMRSTSDNVLAGSDEAKRVLYYGRLNAYKALIYNNGNDRNIPGISSENFLINGNKPAISKIGKSAFEINFKNYLSDAENLKITLKPYDNFIQLETTELDVYKRQTERTT